jgi:predicted phage baseplate assembly protein
LEARGGTIAARHATTIHNEVLGQSDGTPGQTFHLLHTPILARDPERDCLVVEPPNAEPQEWHEVDDFADSLAEDHHYTLDDLDGTLTLGPCLLQPDGSVYRFGAIPAKGSLLRFRRYQYGGGVAGNVPRGVLSVLKSSIPYVAQVINREPALGGRDAQSLEDAKLRAPQALRSRTRAVTADDYEFLASQVPGVARARCLAPGAQPATPTDPQPGQVVVAILPQAATIDGRVPPEQLTLSAELRAGVLAALDARRLLATRLDVRQSHYVWVSVRATLRLPEERSAELANEVKRKAEAELYRFLNPYLGGSGGAGWPFGRDLYVSEIYGLLQRVPSVEFVEDVTFVINEHGSTGSSQSAAPKLALPPHGLICSGQHEVTVR